MTRMRSPHNFHEVKTHDPESICAKCGKADRRTMRMVWFLPYLS